MAAKIQMATNDIKSPITNINNDHKISHIEISDLYISFGLILHKNLKNKDDLFIFTLNKKVLVVLYQPSSHQFDPCQSSPTSLKHQPFYAVSRYYLEESFQHVDNWCR